MQLKNEAALGTMPENIIQLCFRRLQETTKNILERNKRTSLVPSLCPDFFPFPFVCQSVRLSTSVTRKKSPKVAQK